MTTILKKAKRNIDQFADFFAIDVDLSKSAATGQNAPSSFDAIINLDEPYRLQSSTVLTLTPEQHAYIGLEFQLILRDQTQFKALVDNVNEARRRELYFMVQTSQMIGKVDSDDIALVVLMQQIQKICKSYIHPKGSRSLANLTDKERLQILKYLKQAPFKVAGSGEKMEFQSASASAGYASLADDQPTSSVTSITSSPGTTSTISAAAAYAALANPSDDNLAIKTKTSLVETDIPKTGGGIESVDIRTLKEGGMRSLIDSRVQQVVALLRTVKSDIESSITQTSDVCDWINYQRAIRQFEERKKQKVFETADKYPIIFDDVVRHYMLRNNDDLSSMKISHHNINVEIAQLGSAKVANDRIVQVFGQVGYKGEEDVFLQFLLFLMNDNQHRLLMFYLDLQRFGCIAYMDYMAKQSSNAGRTTTPAMICERPPAHVWIDIYYKYYDIRYRSDAQSNATESLFTKGNLQDIDQAIRALNDKSNLQKELQQLVKEQNTRVDTIIDTFAIQYRRVESHLTNFYWQEFILTDKYKTLVAAWRKHNTNYDNNSPVKHKSVMVHLKKEDLINDYVVCECPAHCDNNNNNIDSDVYCAPDIDNKSNECKTPQHPRLLSYVVCIKATAVPASPVVVEEPYISPIGPVLVAEEVAIRKSNFTFSTRYRYPSYDRRVRPLPDNLGELCFPDNGDVKGVCKCLDRDDLTDNSDDVYLSADQGLGLDENMSMKMNSGSAMANKFTFRMFNFVITQGTNFLHAACLQVRDSNCSTTDTVKDNTDCYAIVLISAMPFFDLLRVLLIRVYKEIEALLLASQKGQSGAVLLLSDDIMQQLFTSNTWKTVQSLTHSLKHDVDMWSLKDAQINVPRIDFSMDIMFSCLKPQRVVYILEALLNEKKVILFSKSYSILSYVSSTLLSLLYPFQWDYLHIPVLPFSMLHYLDCPTPYIVGVHMCYKREVLQQLRSCMDESVLVDLENDEVVTAAAYSCHRIPPPYRNRLIQTMHNHFYARYVNIDCPDRQHNNNSTSMHRQSNGKDVDISCNELLPINVKGDIVVRFQLLKLWCDLLSHYRAYCMVIPHPIEPVVLFDSRSFMIMKGYEDEEFVNETRDTTNSSDNTNTLPLPIAPVMQPSPALSTTSTHSKVEAVSLLSTTKVDPLPKLSLEFLKHIMFSGFFPRFLHQRLQSNNKNNSHAGLCSIDGDAFDVYEDVVSRGHHALYLQRQQFVRDQLASTTQCSCSHMRAAGLFGSYSYQCPQCLSKTHDNSIPPNNEYKSRLRDMHNRYMLPLGWAMSVNAAGWLMSSNRYRKVPSANEANMDKHGWQYMNDVAISSCNNEFIDLQLHEEEEAAFVAQKEFEKVQRIENSQHRIKQSKSAEVTLDSSDQSSTSLEEVVLKTNHSGKKENDASIWEKFPSKDAPDMFKGMIQAVNVAPKAGYLNLPAPVDHTKGKDKPNMSKKKEEEMMNTICAGMDTNKTSSSPISSAGTVIAKTTSTSAKDINLDDLFDSMTLSSPAKDDKTLLKVTLPTRRASQFIAQSPASALSTTGSSSFMPIVLDKVVSNSPLSSFLDDFNTEAE